MLASEFEKLGDYLAGSPLASVIAIAIVAFACMVPGLTAIAPLDGDEPGYVVAAREMVTTGDYATVRLQTENAEWRPRGAYWIQALLFQVAGGSQPIWVARLPSLIGGVAAAIFAWWLAMAFGAPRTALLTGLFTAASGIVGLEARLAVPDAIGLAAITLCGGALAWTWRRSPRYDDVVAGLFWTGLGVAVLFTGVVPLGIVAIAVVILSIERGTFRWLMQLRPAVGVVWFFLIVSPWLIALILAVVSPTDGPSSDYLAQIGVPFELRAPPGSYLLLLPLLAGPAATFIFTGLPWFAAELRRPVIFFALAWGAPLWLAAEFVTVKQPQTILAAIPMVALLAAAAIDVGAARIGGRISWFYSLGPMIWPPFVAIVVPIVFVIYEQRFPTNGFVALVLASVLGPITWLWLRRGKLMAAALLSVVTVFFIYLGFFGSFVPGLAGIRIGERVSARAAEAVPCKSPAFASAGYPEESLVLALGPDTRLVDAWSAADFLNSAGCRVAVIDASQISAFRQRAEDLGLDLADLGRIGGLDLRKMRKVDIHLFMTKGATG